MLRKVLIFKIKIVFPLLDSDGRLLGYFLIGGRPTAKIATDSSIKGR